MYHTKYLPLTVAWSSSFPLHFVAETTLRENEHIREVPYMFGEFAQVFKRTPNINPIFQLCLADPECQQQILILENIKKNKKSDKCVMTSLNITIKDIAI